MSLALYLCPMKQRPGGALGRLTRYCAMDEFTPEITARMAGGEWREAEIDGFQAIVGVRASDAVLASLALVFPPLTAVQAAAAWTPTRSLPIWDSGTGTFKATLQTAPTKTLTMLSAELPAVAPPAILGAWLTVGFGLGWRLPHDLVQYAVAHHLEPGRWADLLLGAYTLYGRQWADVFEQLLHSGARLISGGVFPTTGLLDNFNRTAENPLANGNWSGPTFGGGAQCKSDGTAATAAAAFGNSYWSAATFGADTEVFQTLSALDAAPQEGNAWRLTSPGVLNSERGYELFAVSGTGFEVYRIDVNQVETKLGATISQTYSAGDKFGAEMIGSTITVEYKAGAGAWGSIGTRTDANLTTAGNIGCSVKNVGTDTLDDFSGGTVVVVGGWGGLLAEQRNRLVVA